MKKVDENEFGTAQRHSLLFRRPNLLRFLELADD